MPRSRSPGRHDAACGRALAGVQSAGDSDLLDSITVAADEETLGEYRLEGRLGRGGMGTAYRGRGPDGEVVAVKVLADDLVADAAARRRFEKEASVLARLRHPRIVSARTGLLEDGGRLFYAMELVEGSDLSEVLARRGSLPLRRALGLLSDVLAALEFAHGHGILHRDVKPSNVFVLPSGRAKLGDFGLARADGATRLTETGTALGTPEYMAPEQAEGEAGEPRTDVYAAGIVLWELLAGRPPFTADKPLAVLRCQVDRMMGDENRKQARFTDRVVRLDREGRPVELARRFEELAIDADKIDGPIGVTITREGEKLVTVAPAEAGAELPAFVVDYSRRSVNRSIHSGMQTVRPDRPVRVGESWTIFAKDSFGLAALISKLGADPGAELTCTLEGVRDGWVTIEARVELEFRRVGGLSLDDNGKVTVVNTIKAPIDGRASPDFESELVIGLRYRAMGIPYTGSGRNVLRVEKIEKD